MLFVRMNGFVSIFVGYFKYYKQAIEENVDTLKSIPYSLKRISISVLSNFWCLADLFGTEPQKFVQ